MNNIYTDILFNICNTEEQLQDVLGYFESFGEDKTTTILLAIGLIFSDSSIFIVAQEDDSLNIYNNIAWKQGNKYKEVSLIETMQWFSAKGKPLLWTWMLYNQQGYFDGLQMEFAKDSQDISSVIQLVAQGSEIKFRVVSNNLEGVKPGTLPD